MIVLGLRCSHSGEPTWSRVKRGSEYRREKGAHPPPIFPSSSREEGDSRFLGRTMAEADPAHVFESLRKRLDCQLCPAFLQIRADLANAGHKLTPEDAGMVII
jgi:hypothetical protein